MSIRRVVLLVTPNEEFLSVQRYLLATWGYRVLTALDATDALILHARGDVELVVGYPGIDWQQLADRMKQQRPNVPLLLFGGRDIGAANLAPVRMTACELRENMRALMVARRMGVAA
jgi:DNA-binding response OmpR family regulator